MLDKLEKKGYILRTHSAKDRRKINISLTDCGKKIVQTIQEAFIVTEEEILKHLKQDEINTMLNTYEKIIDITEETLLGKDYE